MRRLAFFLARLAAWFLPDSRAEWAEEMRAELHYLDDREVLPWAFGYLVASCKERISAMKPEGRLNIAISLLFAVAILISAKLFKSSGHADIIVWILIALWMIPYGYLTRKEGRYCRRP